jgi:hypothetical protein
VNYFAHGRGLVESPYELAGAALPDWLMACDRGARLRRERIEERDDPAARALAAGVRRHLDDDAWFHRTGAFLATSAALSERIRALDPADERLRAGFWGHVLVEILLDARLIEEDPGRLDAYYAALDRVDPARVEVVAAPWATRPPRGLGAFIDRFRRWRFLYAYREDEPLLRRLDGLAHRVGLPPLPLSFLEELPAARRMVADRAADLLRPP